jgi:phosphopantothenoylcysteine decarboxylase/phosphopantothenate--cysteine ligase
MHEAVMGRVSAVDIYIGTAAVADYAPIPAAGKIKKNADELVLTLSKTVDILAAVASHPSRPFTVGFAAETSQLETYARQKLVAKSLDMVAANQVGEGLGFDVDQNALYVCWSEGEANLPFTSKTLLAEQLLTLITDRYHAKHPAQNS